MTLPGRYLIPLVFVPSNERVAALPTAVLRVPDTPHGGLLIPGKGPESEQPSPAPTAAVSVEAEAL